MRWDADGSFTELDGLGGARSEARGIDASGVVVGSAERPDGRVHAVRWDEDGTVVDLGTLPGDATSRATGVNDDGVVVGESVAGDDTPRAVRWEPDGTMVDVSALIESG
ncbi:hypothetical protein [Streptomyces sp. CMB-StM0423]|uniref:hypothetical protein n=1 Tax=Streptomyces sp. CMB-StM0423 TaxID=2059884 RepID=UPI00131DC20B|nr:hypothetical protein [Streptomyces sp. CMB-StM0423]